MKISLKWLNDFVDISDFASKPNELGQLLTDKGLEVESVEDRSRQFNHIVIGVILEKSQHPDADRLTVCQVSTGSGRIHQIVCGAKNHNANDKVAVALPGAVLPGGMEIQTTRMRGVESAGMLCSAKELGLSTEGQGLLILPADAPIGESISKYLGQDDIVFELKVTPNRADCLSHLGLARELSCLLDRPLKQPEVKLNPSPESSAKFVEIVVKDPVGCPAYCARVVHGIKVKPSPAWLKNRLEVVGLRPINNVVDVTNYVMLELGQPLHAFDQKKLAGGQIIIGPAQDNEEFTTLFDQKLNLQSSDLTIRDKQRPIALAGVIGGQNSGIDDSTTDVVIESALFNMQKVRRTSRRFGLQTDAAHRFSRGVNPELTELAMNRACELLAETAEGQVLSEPWLVRVDLPVPNSIRLSTDLVAKRLGYSVEENALESVLRRLGCQVERILQNNELGQFRVVPPRWRLDLDGEMDLVEEFARLNGYDKIPDHTPEQRVAPTPDVFVYRFEKEIRATLSHRGLYQAVNYAFGSSKFESEILGEAERWLKSGLLSETGGVKLLNPLSADMDIMRQSLIPGLIANATHNIHQGVETGSLYEIGFSFSAKKNEYTQHHRLALIQWGEPNQVWGRFASEGRPMPQAFMLQSNLSALFRKLDLALKFEPIKEIGYVPRTFHPMQVVHLKVAEHIVGVLGTLHPEITEKQKLRGEVAIAELNLDRVGGLIERQLRGYKVFSRFPSIQRDVAWIVPMDLPAQNLVDFVRCEAGGTAENVYVFDQYTGPGTPEGHRSLAMRVILRKMDGTFSETESQDVMARIINAVCKKFEITVR